MASARVENPGQSSPQLTEEARYRLLVEAVTDYAIYMLDPEGVVNSWNPGAQRFKGYTAAEIMGQHFSRFYTAGGPAGRPAPRAPGDRRERGPVRGRRLAAFARTEAASGPTWSSTPSVIRRRVLIGFAKITRDLTERRQAEESLRRQRGAVPAAGPRGHRLRDLHARPRRPRDAAGTPAPSASRATGRRRSSASTSPTSTPTEDRADGEPRARSRRPAREGTLRERGLAGPQGRQPLLGQRRHRPDPRRRRRADRVRQGHARHHRAPRGPAGARARPRSAVPVAEARGNRPAHGRRRARLQQPADGHHEQPGTGSQARWRRPENGPAAGERDAGRDARGCP